LIYSSAKPMAVPAEVTRLGRLLRLSKTYNRLYNPAYNLRSMSPAWKTGILHHRGSMVSIKDPSQPNHTPRSKGDPDTALSQPRGRVYRITVRGQLADDWSDWFEGLQMTTSDGGNTVLSGTIVDQAALMGVLNKLNRLNVTLLSLGQVDHTEQL